jgi:hydrogenase maturation protease
LDVPGILIIGYGNELRGDDAAGVLAARELKRYFQDDDEVEVIAAQQLAPEMAEVVSRSSFVIFLDAANDGRCGSIACEPIEPEGDNRRFTHYFTAATLLVMAEQIYGQAPPAISQTLSGWSFGLGGELSNNACERLPEFVRQAKEVVASHRWLVRETTDSCLPVG